MVEDIPLDIKVAVMGCAVNGPGEAREADIGIAGGIGEGLLIKKGPVSYTHLAHSRYAAYIERRAGHVPLQHITGSQEFMGLKFRVTEHVLIPRQDTEILVEEALKILREEGLPAQEGKLRVLDLCTGLSLIHISHCRRYTLLSRSYRPGWGRKMCIRDRDDRLPGDALLW